MKLTDLRAYACKGWQGLIATLHNSLAAVGLATIVFVGLDGTTLIELAPQLATSTAYGKVSEESPLAQPVAVLPASDPRHRVLATHLSRKYRVAAAATEELVGEAFAAGRDTGVDPLLILAVISVESRFNPIAESDFGAKGLMQVVPRFHLDKLAHHGGAESVLDPRTNIRVGARILKEYIQRTGSLESGLQMYAGAIEDPANGYAQRVMNEKASLQRLMPAAPRRGGTAA